MTAVTVTSFGYGHAAPPEADITLDVRTSLRDPHHDPAMRDLTGKDDAVREHVMATAGAERLVAHVTSLVADMLDDIPAERLPSVHVAIGCVGGRHRSVALAEEVADRIRAAWVEHRDICKPVIQR